MASFSPIVFTGGYQHENQPGVRAFGLNTETGALAACGEYCGITAPSFLALHPNGRWLYAVSETGMEADQTAGHVQAIALDRSGEAVKFTRLNTRPSGGDFPCHAVIDPSGKWLVASNYGSGVVSAFAIREDGSLDPCDAPVQHHGHGPNPERQEGPHTHSAIFTPDGQFVIVADLGIDALVIYRLVDGRFEKVTNVAARPGAGPRHMAFHPNRRVLYVVNELDSTLVAYDYADGNLSERATLPTLPESSPGNLAADLHLAPGGERVYVSNRGDNSLAVFAANPQGALAPLTFAPCGGNWPRNFALAPDGRFLLVANQYSNEVVTLPLQPGTGEIAAPLARVPVPGVSCVVFAPARF